MLMRERQSEAMLALSNELTSDIIISFGSEKFNFLGKLEAELIGADLRYTNVFQNAETFFTSIL